MHVRNCLEEKERRGRISCLIQIKCFERHAVEATGSDFQEGEKHDRVAGGVGGRGLGNMGGEFPRSSSMEGEAQSKGGRVTVRGGEGSKSGVKGRGEGSRLGGCRQGELLGWSSYEEQIQGCLKADRRQQGETD